MAVLKTLARGTVKLILGLLLLLTGFYLLLLAINWQDAKPNAANLHMQSMLQQDVIPAAENGYQHFLAHNASNELLLSGTLQQLYGQCSEVQACKESLIAQTDLAALIAEQNQLMAFYQQLLQYSRWQEPPPTMQNIPAYQILLHGQILFLWQAWLEAQNGNIGQVQNALQADYQFWKTVLANNSSMIGKMISTAAIKHHFNLGQIIIRELPTEQRHAAVPEEWTVAFRDSELSLKQVLAGEWYHGAEYMSMALNSEPDNFGTDVNTFETLLIILSRPLMLLEDTKNINATQLQQQDDNNTPATYPWYSWLRNPFGKLIMATGTVPYKDYQQRLLQLEQLRQDALQQIN
jgi:hypothetical protein